ncbi:uncharacterized protein LOC130988139 isoform X2 [Salvia miltiorrhiza]|uniref:uncharacterized protein LOC130988139 isoform X2 n=1 Tax=Salvia miltiorrhiza TaxID=226208 RepID=UPI0025AB90CB|nr:uncharacterized protein LOC130988139 isoform X2 [Salvia miltiorrhiza]
MAGMLPGVEAARRRRFHQKSNHAEPSPAVSGCTRRSSLCLYVSSHDFHLCSSASSTRSQIVCDESRLGAEAREAKKRLDERLQAQWRSETTRIPFPAACSDLSLSWETYFFISPPFLTKIAPAPRFSKCANFNHFFLYKRLK